jgi:hypothetical protein
LSSSIFSELQTNDHWHLQSPIFNVPHRKRMIQIQCYKIAPILYSCMGWSTKRSLYWCLRLLYDPLHRHCFPIRKHTCGRCFNPRDYGQCLTEYKFDACMICTRVDTVRQPWAPATGMKKSYHSNITVPIACQDKVPPKDTHNLVQMMLTRIIGSSICLRSPE